MGILALAILWYRSEAFRHEAEKKEATTAYLMVAEKLLDQNQAILGWEAEAKDQRKRAQIALEKARREGAARLDRATALERAMASLEAPSDCPAGDSVKVVRSILRGEIK